MADLGDDIRTTAEAIRDEVAELARIEARKETMDPADPVMLELAHSAERLAERIRDDTATERALVERGAETTPEDPPG